MASVPVDVGLLGATGIVGQQFIRQLESHPWFRLSALGASSRNAGRRYGDAVSWKLGSAQLPERVAALTISECRPEHFTGCRAIFSALDSSVAGDIELEFARAGFKIFSNARNWRYDDHVPIIVPYVNSEHVDVLSLQRIQKGFKSGGFIVTNANCSSTGLVVPLKALHMRYGLENVFVVTMQAVSGAGYPGVASLDILDNIFPFISGEEPKMELEPRKILGAVDINAKEHPFIYADFKLSAMCNRVAVADGHTECISVKLRNPPTSLADVVETLRSFTTAAQTLKLPSAPKNPMVVLEVDDRPQPRLDRDAGRGMVVSVGRVRKCNLFDVKFNIVSHNTVLGAAGGSILNAELVHAKGMLLA